MDDKSLAHAAHPPTRELRALDLYRTRGHKIRCVGEDLYLVPSCTGWGFYSVDYREETCGCPNFQYHGENCKHVLAVGIYVAKRRLHVSVAGDPFAAAGGDHDHDHGQARPCGQDRPCACLDGWVSMQVETEDGETEEVLYLCRRCPKQS